MTAPRKPEGPRNRVVRDVNGDLFAVLAVALLPLGAWVGFIAGRP